MKYVLRYSASGLVSRHVVSTSRTVDHRTEKSSMVGTKRTMLLMSSTGRRAEIGLGNDVGLTLLFRAFGALDFDIGLECGWWRQGLATSCNMQLERRLTSRLGRLFDRSPDWLLSGRCVQHLCRGSGQPHRLRNHDGRIPGLLEICRQRSVHPAT